ncbi:GNAT family N-acetyltransferase [Novosphingobium sp. 1949]|uniref:GNAT family N-acetyltransferase n=1 Tax=Novosphingobium organovorum TaxID=2930092 RepID=A0ABT0B962_9SPHN|nr:GNAT family N-acetyltransferase [Novosphingobium organovorum]MCJ2181610.1 GNAT family N-acetyltransferase [Novosphingobium organovorum]
MAVMVTVLRERQIAPVLDALAQLRQVVFAQWPYLYDGDAAYERDYVREFAAEPDSVLIAARDGARIVGMATASPMGAQKEAFRAPFAARGIDTGALFYFGESVLLAPYRGQGIGHAFFDQREACALAVGARAACFAAVVRPEDHPDRPADYRALDGFWRKRGYAPVEGLVTPFAWKDHRDEHESEKPMQFWLRHF